MRHSTHHNCCVFLAATPGASLGEYVCNRVSASQTPGNTAIHSQSSNSNTSKAPQNCCSNTARPCARVFAIQQNTDSMGRARSRVILLSLIPEAFLLSFHSIHMHSVRLPACSFARFWQILARVPVHLTITTRTCVTDRTAHETTRQIGAPCTPSMPKLSLTLFTPDQRSNCFLLPLSVRLQRTTRGSGERSQRSTAVFKSLVLVRPWS